MNDKNILIQLNPILQKYINQVDIQMTDRIYHDYDLMGDTVEELFKDIEKHFSISLKNFNVWEYFPSETDPKNMLLEFSDLITNLLRYFAGLKKIDRLKEKYKPYTVSDLVSLIKEAMEQ